MMKVRTSGCFLPSGAVVPVRSLHYAVLRDFGKIYRTWRGRSRSDLVGHRSLTAAQAANDFTRNCVLGFTGNWYFQIGSAIRGCAECFYGTLRTLIRISYSGLPVPLLRYGERYALFMSSAKPRARMSRFQMLRERNVSDGK